MRETPSGGVGSIQDQGVNYIQLNIQPPIPLLNTELRNATLNKDYERSTPLDRAQLTAQSGQPGPRGPRTGGGVGGTERKGEFGMRARPGMGASPSKLLPFLPKPACWAGLGSPHSVPTRSAPSSASPQGPEKWRLEFRASVSSWAPWGTGPRPSVPAFAALPRPRCVEEAPRASQLPGPGRDPRPAAQSCVGMGAALWAARGGVSTGTHPGCLALT